MVSIIMCVIQSQILAVLVKNLCVVLKENFPRLPLATLQSFPWTDEELFYDETAESI